MAGRYKSELPRSRHYIAEWREFKGLTQDELAARIRMSGPNLSRLENHLQDYTQGILDTIADVLGCHPGDLITRDPRDENTPYSFYELTAIVRAVKGLRN